MTRVVAASAGGTRKAVNKTRDRTTRDKRLMNAPSCFQMNDRLFTLEAENQRQVFRQGSELDVKFTEPARRRLRDRLCLVLQQDLDAVDRAAAVGDRRNLADEHGLAARSRTLD